MEKIDITGLRLPKRVVILSARYPMTGLNTAFHTEPIATMTPAMAGGISAIVVRKKRKNVPTKPYEMASPREAMPYPNFSLNVVFSIKEYSFRDKLFRRHFYCCGNVCRYNRISYQLSIGLLRQRLRLFLQGLPEILCLCHILL